MKVVLVMDMPENCYECPACYNLIGCSATGNHLSVEEAEAELRPGFCPLRPMPEKATLNQKDDEYYQGLVRGRNEVIEEIEGSGEDD